MASAAIVNVSRVIGPFIPLCHCWVEIKKGRIRRMKYWEIIADNLSKTGWSWGCVSAIDSNGRTIWIADAHRDDGKRFVVRVMKCVSQSHVSGEALHEN
jgi:hypothetical protein